MFVPRHRSYGRCAVVAAVAMGLMLASAPATKAGFVRQRSVGGVVVSAEGTLRDPEVDELNELKKMRQEILKQVPEEVNQASSLRMISLKRLQKAIQERIDKTASPTVTEDMHYLGGLTRIQYVFVYPEENDIVIAGPAEPMTFDERGHMVGADTGAPILQLDHLLVALRTAESAARNPITCSIDPTPEGIQRLQQYLSQPRQFDSSVAQNIEKLMGPQKISLTGIPEDSDFARTLVAADYRMKRIGMGLEKSGVRGIPSYLGMIKGGNVGLQNATPRWWMAPNYDKMLKSDDGLAWELRGQGVKVMTEDSFVAEVGGARPSGQTSPVATKWAELMTEHFQALTEKQPIFGELRNVMDMAVVGALIVKERLADQAGCDLSVLMSDDKIGVGGFNVPREVDTKASIKKAGRKYVVTASGGVEVSSWHVADRIETGESLSPVRSRAKSRGDHWWW